MKTTLALFASMVVALAPDIAGATCSVTKERYAALTWLSTYADVVKLFGCDGEQTFRREDPGMASTTYMWDGAVPRSTITLGFGNDRLMGKSNHGLD
jgi:hypothetical protein